MVYQDRWSLMAVVSQDRIHSIGFSIRAPTCTCFDYYLAVQFVTY